MNTGQMVFTIIAFIFVFTILTNFYGQLATTGDDIKHSQDAILETSVANSWIDLAMGLQFDNVTATDTTPVRSGDVNRLTASTSFGQDAGDTAADPTSWDDFDDFHNMTCSKTIGNDSLQYMTNFKVYYVAEGTVNTPTTTKSFLKRMDLKVWRSRPEPQKGEKIDTLFTSVVMGYFKIGWQ